MPLIEGGGAIGCDIPEGGGALAGSSRGQGAKEGGRCSGGTQKTSFKHDERDLGYGDDRARAELSAQPREARSEK